MKRVTFLDILNWCAFLLRVFVFLPLDTATWANHSPWPLVRLVPTVISYSVLFKKYQTIRLKLKAEMATTVVQFQLTISDDPDDLDPESADDPWRPWRPLTTPDDPWRPLTTPDDPWRPLTTPDDPWRPPDDPWRPLMTPDDPWPTATGDLCPFWRPCLWPLFVCWTYWFVGWMGGKFQQFTPHILLSVLLCEVEGVKSC